MLFSSYSALPLNIAGNKSELLENTLQSVFSGVSSSGFLQLVTIVAL